MTSHYAFIDQDEDGEVHAYPSIHAYVTRDQGLYNVQELRALVVGDIIDVLYDSGYLDESSQASVIRADIGYLPWTSTAGGGRVIDDQDASDQLEWLADAAEALPHALVEWDGDTGMVRITCSDSWVHISSPSTGLTDDERRSFCIVI